MTLAFPCEKRLQTLQNKTGGGVNITKLDYTYDPAGRILSVTDQLGATNPWKATGYNGANPYDAASQLTTWQTKDTVTGTQKYSYPFSYDTSGNRTSDWLNTSYTPNNLNEIVSRTDLGGTTYTLGYDFNGNRTSDSGPTYEWNGADELSAYNFGNNRYEFSYNGDGHLWQAVKKVGGVVQNTYRYLWIGDQVREQRDRPDPLPATCWKPSPMTPCHRVPDAANHVTENDASTVIRCSLFPDIECRKSLIAINTAPQNQTRLNLVAFDRVPYSVHFAPPVIERLFSSAMNGCLTRIAAISLRCPKMRFQRWKAWSSQPAVGCLTRIRTLTK